MNRLDFLGLNSNEAACALLYLTAVLWVLNFSARRIPARIGLIIAEAVLVVLVARTMSRGAVVTLVGALACVWWLGKKGGTGISACAKPQRGKLFDIRHRQECLCYFFSYSPVWRLLLLLSSPGLWARAAPGFVAHDASIGNRLELWRGAVKLIATAPWGGWGYTRTGASYMNWFQGVGDHTYYNGVVNGYLQIGAGLGLPVLFAMLAVAGVALFQAHGRVARATRTHGQDARATQTGGFAVHGRVARATQSHGRVARATQSHGLEARATLLCFFWMLIWAIMSCFSSMFASPLLVIPPAAGVVVGLVLNPPGVKRVLCSVAGALGICVLVFAAGWVLARGDSLSIKRDASGVVTVTNNKGEPGKGCVIYVDEGVLGAEFGKEVRKFMAGSDFEACRVIDKVAQTFLSVQKTEELITGTDRNVRATLKTDTDKNVRATLLIILSGITIDRVGMKDAGARYVLLNPSFLPQSLPVGQIQGIVYPEINRGRYIEPDAASLGKFQGKIRMVPFDENFETSWASYITSKIPNYEIPNPK